MQLKERRTGEEQQDFRQLNYKLSYSSKNLVNKEIYLLFANQDRSTSNNHQQKRNHFRNISTLDK